jgi:hypothetical protein
MLNSPRQLCRRSRKLARSAKLPTVIHIAISREVAGFFWTIAREIGGADSTKNARKLTVHPFAGS